MLVIRLSRVGKKNHPQYKVVVAEKTAPIKGRFVEQLGGYDPHHKIATVNSERVQYWISQGATCSDTAWNILVSQKVIDGEKRKVKLPEKPAPDVPEDGQKVDKQTSTEKTITEKKETEPDNSETKSEEKPIEEPKEAQKEKKEEKDIEKK